MYLESAKLIYNKRYTKVIRPVSRISPVYLQINYKDTPGLTDLYLGSQHVQDVTDETPYLRASPIEQATGDMEQLTCPRPTTLCSRASPIEQATGDIEQPTSPGTTDQLQRYTRVNRPVSRTTICPISPDGQEQL